MCDELVFYVKRLIDYVLCEVPHLILKSEQQPEQKFLDDPDYPNRARLTNYYLHTTSYLLTTQGKIPLGTVSLQNLVQQICKFK